MIHRVVFEASRAGFEEMEKDDSCRICIDWNVCHRN